MQGDVQGQFQTGDFGKIDIAEFRKAHAEIAEAEGAQRIVRVKFGQEPSAAGARQMQFDDRNVIFFALLLRGVSEELFVLGAGKEMHKYSFLWWNVAEGLALYRSGFSCQSEAVHAPFIDILMRCVGGVHGFVREAIFSLEEFGQGLRRLFSRRVVVQPGEGVAVAVIVDQLRGHLHQRQRVEDDGVLGKAEAVLRCQGGEEIQETLKEVDAVWFRLLATNEGDPFFLMLIFR